jgi:transcriptional regulator with PAS, ATPase and Fis domain
VKLNLAAIPESMVEAELFGSAKGAFTDAKRDRPGLFATADGGTILLDEITEFKIDLQPKLLRVLEERRYFPIGMDHERTIDIRVLAATNRNPLLAIGEGKLRSDLYYRIGTVIIEVPPLRDRREDIVPLAEHFLQWFAAEFGRSIEGFSKPALELLGEHRWPGNVRELRNVVERAVIMSDGTQVTPKELGLVRQPDKPEEPIRSLPPLKLSELPLQLEGAKQKALASIEKKQIERALKLAGGNRTTAALLLGISRSTLWEKLKLYGL